MPTSDRLYAAVLVAAVVAPLAIAGLVLLVRRPQRGVLVLVALAPFDGLLLLVPSPGLLAGWKEALALVIAGATLIAPLSARGAPGRRPPIWFSLIAAWVLLTVAVTATLGGGLADIYAFKIAFFYLVVLAALWRCPFDRRERDLLLTVLLVDAVMVSLYGIVQQVLGGAALNAFGYEYNETIRTAGGQLRSFSSFNQPFAFAFFLMVVFLLLLPSALQDPRRLRHQVYFAVTPLLLLGVLSAIVRAALLGIAVGVALIAFRRHRWLAMTLPPVFVALFFVPASTLATLVSPSSLRERVAGWAVSLQDLPQNPLGQGLGTVGAAAQRAAAEAADTTATTIPVYQPDNYYFKTALEIGILGAWIFVLFLLTVLAVTTRTSRELTGPDAAVSLGISATIVAAAAASVVATYFEIFPLDLIFWVLLGVAASLDPASRPPDPPPDGGGTRHHHGASTRSRQDAVSSA